MSYEYDHYCDDEYEEEEFYEEEPTCDYTGEEYCIISIADYEIEKRRKNPVTRILDRLSFKRPFKWIMKKRQETLDNLYGTSALIAVESCSFICPLRPR